MMLGNIFSQWGYLLFFLYPLGILISAFSFGRVPAGSAARLECDRLFVLRQRRRKLMLAFCASASIGLLWWAGENGFWRESPGRMLAVVSVLVGLFFVSAALRTLIRRASVRYADTVIESLRFQQVALRIELEDLRKRLQSVQVADAM
jgi:hypothetical protein